MYDSRIAEFLKMGRNGSRNPPILKVGPRSRGQRKMTVWEVALDSDRLIYSARRRSARPRQSYWSPHVGPVPRLRERTSCAAKARCDNAASDPAGRAKQPPSPSVESVPYVREIVRVAKNSHGGDLPKCPQGPDLSGFIAGAARGIRTPDPVITNDVL